MLQFRKSCGIWEAGQFAVKGVVNSQSQESCKKRKTQKMYLLMNYIIKISQSTRDEIVEASLFSVHVWKNINLSKHHWVNLRKENDCAWKCLGDGVCQLMNWEATVCSSLHSKSMHKLSPKKEIFSFSPIRGMQGHFALCFICNSFFSFHKTWWLLSRESLLQVAGQGVMITHTTRSPFAFRFVDFDDKPSPLSFSVLSAASPTAQRCFLY